MTLAFPPIASTSQDTWWWDIGVRLVDSMPGILTALAGVITAIVIARRGEARTNARTKRVEANLDAVRESVVNDHPRPARYDLDDILAEVRTVSIQVARVDDRQRKMCNQVDALDERTSRIGDEVRHDRDMRRIEDARIRRELAAAIDRAEHVIAKHHPEDA